MVAGAASVITTAFGAHVLAVVGRPVLQVQDLVEAALTTVGAIASAWFAVSALAALVCLLAHVTGRRWSTVERIVARHAPVLVRRAARAAAGAGLGLSLSLGGTAALAAEHAPEPTVSVSTTTASTAADPHERARTGAGATATHASLGWRPTGTDHAPAATGTEALGATRSATADPTVGEPHATGTRAGYGSSTDMEPTGAVAASRRSTNTVDRGGPEPHVVVRGDTLWSIAAAQLPDDATDADVARATASWHSANLDVIGTDPDLILPGQVLAAPR
ncbi:hypothetical protein GCM10025865_22140 [Paraoerskovia sediminicola]|uniref:LysM domain-containing protein n=1 Tax=Paraoerskovia sediminicola TaxID=1138587 RepID=A0ABM8G4A3_9CELL|nr:hypothetical protein GCM10025865_22140 [Paraoerskovia sediminicola]